MMEDILAMDFMASYFWILVAVCVALIVVGIILLAGKRKRRNAEGAFSSQVVHRVADMSVGMDLADEEESVIIEDPGSAECRGNNPSNRKVLPEEQADTAVPVAPYTHWDMPEKKGSEEPEDSFAGFVVREVESTEAPVPGEPEFPASVLPDKHRTAVQREKRAEIALEPQQQLLLLKSHELLLTLSDGLKKISAAKTDAVRKEKIAEMQAAMKLLDAKNEWADYKACFEKLYPDFWPAIEALASEEMSPYELRLCALLSLDMGTKEVADLTNRSVRTVETTIYKIRKKLNMDTEEKTQDFLKRIRKNG